MVRTGFVPANAALHRAYNLVIVSLLLALALPVMAVISLALVVTQGPGIFYRGERLGRDRKPFHILKFRTLNRADAQQLTKDRVLPKDSGIETPLGRYLRASRLDELPQLINILLGDMNICGPRPVRRNLALIECARNPGYGVRFRVKPGLVGHTQAYMSHGASKRLRAKYNYMLCVSPVAYRWELVLFVRVGLSVGASAMNGLLRRLVPANRVREAYRRAERWQLCLTDPETGCRAPVAAVSRDQIVVPASSALSFSGRKAVLQIQMAGGGLRKARLSVHDIGPVAGGWAYGYTPSTPAACYLVDRYLFEDAVVRPLARPRRSGWFRRRRSSGTMDARHVPAE